ncbi:MAG: hypothetical protein VX492_01165 [Candidatus Thermoplasmatota archaeon]|nr:hypothetical protein [Candidatus Thalassarchaeum sp.]MEE2629449.1 hypothetical protein [Candidatus Thermoplasmatota archaeon]
MVMTGLQAIAVCPSCGSPCLVYQEFVSTNIRTTSCMTCGVVSLTVS